MNIKAVSRCLFSFLVLQAATALADDAAPKPPPSDGKTATITIPADLHFTVTPHPKVEYKGWSFEAYGFAEFDAIHDTTQGLGISAGNGLVARPGTASASHSQTQFDVSNSRLGFNLGSPSWRGVKVGGIFEMDFLGNQPPIQQTGTLNGSNAVAGGVSEAANFNNPGFRVRHLALKIESPYVDILAGQYWELFGWQSDFQPNTVEIQGVPGEVYARTAQIRLSHTFKTQFVNFDLAAAMLRPPERDSGLPDGQAGFKISFPTWKGLHTVGATGTKMDALAIGVSGLIRSFAAPNPTSSSKLWRETNGQAVSVDALLPIIRATSEDHSNALAITGSYVNGEGFSDLYTGLTGGFGLLSTNPEGGLGACPQPALANGKAAPCYSAPVDNGMVAFNKSGQLVPIQWQSFIVGLQYYLPGGFLWVSGNYSQMNSSNAHALAAGAGTSTLQSTANELRFADANLFWDIGWGARLGFEYARFMTNYNDGRQADNDRYQLSAFYIF